MAGKSVNKVILVGNLGKDPEVKYTPQGTPVAKLTLATNERYKDKDGQWQDRTEWHNVVMWRTLAETAVRLLKKSALIYIEGKIRTRSFIGKDEIKRYTTEIVVEQFNLVGRASDLKEVESNVSLTQ